MLVVRYKNQTVGRYPITNPPSHRIMSGNTMKIEGIGELIVNSVHDGDIMARLRKPAPRIEKLLVKRVSGATFEFEPYEGSLPSDWKQSPCDYCQHWEVCLTLCNYMKKHS